MNITAYLAYLVNSMPADALAIEVARASAGMLLTVQDRQLEGLPHFGFGLTLFNKIKYMMRNVNTSFISLQQFNMVRVNIPQNKGFIQFQEIAKDDTNNTDGNRENKQNNLSKNVCKNLQWKPKKYNWIKFEIQIKTVKRNRPIYLKMSE